jgi:transposase
LLGLSGFQVLAVSESRAELVVEIETTATRAACAGCGTWAEPHERMVVAIRDLPCFGRPVRLVWNKRRWRCVDADCQTKTWTETSPHISARVLLTDRAAAEACRQVGENARPVAELAEEMGVCWWTVMGAVIEHGSPLVDNPARVGPTTKPGVDETSWLKANRHHRSLYATGMVDRDAGIVIDMVKENSSSDLQSWLERQDRRWLAGITTVTTDLAESYQGSLLSSDQQFAGPLMKQTGRCRGPTLWLAMLLAPRLWGRPVAGQAASGDGRDR